MDKNKPEPLKPELLEKAGKIINSPIVNAFYLKSGAANDVFRIITEGKSLIMKRSKIKKKDLFACEADSLEHLRSTHTVHVPRVVAHEEEFLLMEDLGTEKEMISEKSWRELGRQIGALHNVSSESFGYENNNYIGIWDQKNPRVDNWVDFFYNNRVHCFLDSGKNRVLLNSADRKGLEVLTEKIRDQIPNEAPSLCHGDLWKENIFMAADGFLYVIDPAIHYGLAEADLAMTRLYYHFPEDFYSGYKESRYLAPDWEERLPFYQLKELILMVAQFEHQESLEKLRALIKEYS